LSKPLLWMSFREADEAVAREVMHGQICKKNRLHRGSQWSRGLVCVSSLVLLLYVLPRPLKQVPYVREGMLGPRACGAA